MSVISYGNARRVAEEWEREYELVRERWEEGKEKASKALRLREQFKEFSKKGSSLGLIINLETGIDNLLRLSMQEISYETFGEETKIRDAFDKIRDYLLQILRKISIPKEKYAENLVMFELNTKYYWRDKEKEIDFLKDNIPIEVKYTSKIGKEDKKHIDYFLKKYSKNLGVKKAYIITKDFEGKEGYIEMIPLWKFCFNGLIK